MKYDWYWVPDEETGKEEKLPSNEYPNVFHLSMKNKNLTVEIPDIDENDPSSYDRYNKITNRQFYVEIGHEYETVRINFTIKGEEVVPPGMKYLFLGTQHISLYSTILL